jgi:hypothetical protein
MTTEPAFPAEGAEPDEMDDQPSRPVEDHGGDQPRDGRDVNAGTQADDASAEEADAAREGFEQQLDADRGAESRDLGENVPTDPRSGDFDPPDAPNV